MLLYFELYHVLYRLTFNVIDRQCTHTQRSEAIFPSAVEHEYLIMHPIEVKKCVPAKTYRLSHSEWSDLLQSYSAVRAVTRGTIRNLPVSVVRFGLRVAAVMRSSNDAVVGCNNFLFCELSGDVNSSSPELDQRACFCPAGGSLIGMTHANPRESWRNVWLFNSETQCS